MRKILVAVLSLILLFGLGAYTLADQENPCSSKEQHMMDQEQTGKHMGGSKGGNGMMGKGMSMMGAMGSSELEGAMVLMHEEIMCLMGR